ncbi:DUF423 domain-containing protein [Flavobacterium sp. 25HG05S-40]|uniref:DUF423 domain-containing protein n=1 Tax=Flavobacterium sp. 25HG05S-40 TaxID=3458682 RepID=UPI004043D54B
MEKRIISVAAFMGMTAIILGAFGAHALKKQLSVDQLASFETGVKYQIYHALFLLFVGMNTQMAEKAKKIVLRLVVFGIIFFSGSIYLLTTQLISGIDFKFIGIITPIGGALLILVWGLVFWDFWKSKR